MKYLRKSYWVVLISIFYSCGTGEGSGGVKISGSTENFLGSSIILEQVTEAGLVKIDSLDVENGAFSKDVSISEPAFYRLNFDDRQYVSLILTGDETEVTVNAHGNDPRGFSEVSGSYDTEYRNQMEELIRGYQQEASVFQQQQIAARNAGDAQAFSEAGTNLISLGLRTEKQLKGLIWESTPSLAAFFGAQMIDQEKNYTFLDSVANELLIEMPTNFHVQELVAILDAKKSLAIGS